MSDSITPTQVIAVTGSDVSRRDDQLAVEEPLEIRLHFYQEGQLQRKSVAITMRTPGNDIELARGFLVGEGIVRTAQEVQSCEFSGTRALQGNDSNVVKVTLAPSVTVDLGRLQRHFYTSSSCGVCGKASTTLM